ncbi:sensor histidine kinase [Rathayibacter sp. CAU 1779]
MRADAAARPTAHALAFLRRSAWLMLGAAIGVAVSIAAFSIATILARGVAIPLGIVLAVLGTAALGLVPGARELEVTAARSMLAVESELIVPRHPLAAHRLQNVVWVFAHVLAGTVAAALLFGVLPWLLAGVIAVAIGGAPAAGLPSPATGAWTATAVIGAIVIALACIPAFWAIGVVLAALAPRGLGPTAGDRLAIAEAKLSREAEHVRLARELHDGIGHALTIVSVQAAGGRRALATDPSAADAALGSIETTARTALEELDHLLGVLRDASEDTSGHDGSDRISAAVSDPRTADAALAELIARHRDAGLEVRARIVLPPELAPLVDTTVVRVVGEALTNAQRYAAPGPVDVVIETVSAQPSTQPASPHAVSQAVSIIVASRLDPRRSARRTGGRGLEGIAERTALFGGTASAGPEGDRWLVRASIPVETAR